MLTLPTAPNAVAQTGEPLVAFRLTQSEAAKHGLLERWQAAMKRRAKRTQKKQTAFLRLNESLVKLLARAETEEWSQRKLAEKIGIPETTFRRIRANQVNPFVWLPKIESAAFRLTKR